LVADNAPWQPQDDIVCDSSPAIRKSNPFEVAAFEGRENGCGSRAVLTCVSALRPALSLPGGRGGRRVDLGLISG
jgi:hypothetical protein